MEEKILIRYGELALKGKNRRYFEDRLQQNLKEAVKTMPVQISRMHGRFLALVPTEVVSDAIYRLSKVFGIVSVSLVYAAPLDMDAINETAEVLVRGLPEHLNTFKVETRRSNKNFPLTSPEINNQVGECLLNRVHRLQVDVHKPKFQLFIEVGQLEAYLYHDSSAGPGGLPVGVAGKGLLLLSGGIDSPVAGWMAMKRGLALESLHFHSFPFTSMRSRQKAVDLCRSLALYCSTIPLHMISLTAIQKEIRSECPEELGITLLRRMMLRIAEELSIRGKLQALVTGESLGQVASQTLESLQVISDVTGMLILRPLIGMDKHEIIARAEVIDTYKTSIQPYEDCCTLFVPKRPVTRPNLKAVEEAEKALDIEMLLHGALKTLETELIEN